MKKVVRLTESQLKEIKRIRQLAGIITENVQNSNDLFIKDNERDYSNITVDSEDDTIEVFRQLVLPKYTLDQIPTESIDDLEHSMLEFYRQGDIKTAEDMIEKVDKAIEIGFTKSLYFKKK